MFDLLLYGVATVVIVALVVLIALVLAHNKVKRDALSGKYGTETKWAAELVEDGDTKFLQATQNMSQTEMSAIGMSVESKEELREAVIEYHKEREDRNP